MTAHLHQISIWTLEVDGRPTLAFEAKRYREANELCHQHWLRVELGLQKFNGPFIKKGRGGENCAAHGRGTFRFIEKGCVIPELNSTAA